MNSDRKSLLPEGEWNKNVGTPGFPVTFLHEYAVGLLWDRLENGGPVVVKQLDGSMSGDLIEGGDRVVIPDSMQPIGGVIPDLAVLDKSLRPVRVIEVVVTSPPSEEKRAKLKTLQERGVDVVLVPVRNEEELMGLAPSEADTLRPNWAYQWTPKILDEMRIINRPRQSQMRSQQRGFDKQIMQFMEALVGCEPDTRRQLVKVLQGLENLDSLYPLSPANPKRSNLTSNGVQQS